MADDRTHRRRRARRVDKIYWVISDDRITPAISRTYDGASRLLTLNSSSASNPDIMIGKPVITGTRIPVESILEKLGAGETIETIVAEHARLTREAVLAAPEFGARALRAEVVYPIRDAAA